MGWGWGGSKRSAINNVTAATQGHHKAQHAADSPTLGPERGPGRAELAVEPGLRPLHSGSAEPQEHLDGSWKEEGPGNRNVGLRETRDSYNGQVSQAAEEEGRLLAPHIFGRGGAGPRKG